MQIRACRHGIIPLLALLLTSGGVAAQEPSAPGDEGIEVHGRWTITVVRDGVVVDRREFENALTVGGQTHLARVLSRRFTPGPWTILVEGDGTGSLCANNEFVNGEDTDCAISEAEGEATVTEAPSGTVRLEGTETVVRDGNLTLVNTYQWNCLAQTATVDCQPAGANFGQFTRKALDTPIPVQNGDRIEVTVEISFS